MLTRHGCVGMDALLPWAQLEQRIQPVYPTGQRGRPPTRWPRCCGFTACTYSTTSASRRWRTHSLILRPSSGWLGWRRGLPGRGPAARASGPGDRLAGGPAARATVALGPGRRSRASQAAHGVHPSEGGASLSACETAVRLRVGAVSRLSQEPDSALPAVWASESPIAERQAPA